MFDISHLFSSVAMAQDATPADATPASLMNYLPFILIFGVFYLLVIRPQQAKMAATEKMIKALQRGDRVVLAGGIHGKIVKVEGDKQLIVEIADNVSIKVDRDGVQGLEAKTEPAAPEGEKK